MVHQTPDRLRRGLLLAPDLFWTVNATGLVITVLVTLLFWSTESPGAMVLMVAWLSFLMLANAVFHVTGAIVDRGYVPGLATAILLYLPYCGWIAGQVVRDGRVAPGLHGYRILFLGTRLF